jgi:hypothetical protein
VSTLRTKMTELSTRDRKREYLNLCTQNYAEGVSIAQELFPEQYEKANTGMDPFYSFYDKAIEAKERGNTQEGIRILETAVHHGSAMPYCYEWLAILHSKQENYEQTYEFKCDHPDCPTQLLSGTDWEMSASYWSWKYKYGMNWERKFRDKYETEMILEKDSHFFVGTIHNHPNAWIIVGLFYPPEYEV